MNGDEQIHAKVREVNKYICKGQRDEKNIYAKVRTDILIKQFFEINRV